MGPYRLKFNRSITLASCQRFNPRICSYLISNSRVYISMSSFLKVAVVCVDLGERAPSLRGSTVLCFNPALHNGYKTCSTGPECPTAAALCSVIQHLGQTPSERALSPSCVTVRYQFSSETIGLLIGHRKKNKNPRL